MKMNMFSETLITLLAIASIALAPAARADEWDDWGDDPGDDPGWGEEPSPGDPGYCDIYGHWWVFEGPVEPTCECECCDRYVCTNCGDFDDRNFTPALGHNFVNGVCTRCNEGAITYTCYPAVEPTCTNRGNIKYWYGSNGKYYADEKGLEELSS